MSEKIPAAPKGTGKSGKALWSDVLGRYELEEHELALLREAVRTVDLLDGLSEIASREGLVVDGPHGSKVHPAVTEARQLKLALARVLATLRLPTGDETDEKGTGRGPQRRSGVRGFYSIAGGS